MGRPADQRGRCLWPYARVYATPNQCLQKVFLSFELSFKRRWWRALGLHSYQRHECILIEATLGHRLAPHRLTEGGAALGRRDGPKHEALQKFAPGQVRTPGLPALRLRLRLRLRRSAP